MFVASGIKRNRKADIARLQKDGAVLTYRGRLVLSYDTKTEFSMFVKRFRYLTTNKAWISEGLSDLDDHFGLQENHFNGLIHLDETSEKYRQSFKQILVATSLQHEYSKDTFTR